MLGRYSFKFNILLTTAAFFGFSLPAAAQPHLAIDIKTNGIEGSAQVSDPATTAVKFHTVAKGNLSQLLDLEASGPAGIRGYVEVRQIKRGGNLGAMYRIQFPKKKKGYTSELVDGSASALKIGTAAATEPSQEQIDRIKKATGLSDTVIKILLGYMTEEQIIAQYGKSAVPTPTPTNPYGGGGSDPTPKTEPGSLRGTGLLSKDACDKSVSSYDINFVIDLSHVDRSSLGNSFTVSASINANEGKASAASIKPVSDGKFAPKPLVLIQSVGYSYYSNPAKLQLIKWKAGRPGQPKTLKIEDYVYYRGQALARAIATGVLNGGKGTFEISGGNTVGTACFNLVRTRQKANGYQGGD